MPYEACKNIVFAAAKRSFACFASWQRIKDSNAMFPGSQNRRFWRSSKHPIHTYWVHNCSW